MEFGILGPLEIRDGPRAFQVTGGKQRALLALLLLNANRVVSSDRLIDALWNEEPPGSGATALQVLVSRLRVTLGPGGRHLVTESPGYVLRIRRQQFDLHRFEDLVAQAEEADPARAAAILGEALGLWRGPALAGLEYESFTRTAIERLEEIRLLAIERRVEADLALARHAELVPELELLVAEHPFRERLRGHLMLALYRSGRQAEALEAFKATRQVLVEELGIEPSSALHDLERAILRQDEALELTARAAPASSILVAPLREGQLEALLMLAERLASIPARELIVARVVAPEELGDATAQLRARREALIAQGHSARVAAFSSANPARDLVRLASEQDVDLLLLDAAPKLLDDDVTRSVLRAAPSDVGILVGTGSSHETGPVLVPFAGAEHDWAAVELGAWIARSQEVPLWLAGPREEGRDASRLLASASIALQRVLGIVAEPVLVEPGADGIVRAAHDAALVVVGLSDRWRKEGLGTVRLALARDTGTPTLLVRRGLRPGGLAPREAQTRFTWSIVASS
jgi:DNA-binding SARP family transcriptional activator